MLHQELVRALTCVSIILLVFAYYMKPHRESVALKRDCGIHVEPSQITDAVRKECARILKDLEKYKQVQK